MRTSKQKPFVLGQPNLAPFVAENGGLGTTPSKHAPVSPWPRTFPQFPCNGRRHALAPLAYRLLVPPGAWAAKDLLDSMRFRSLSD